MYKDSTQSIPKTNSSSILKKKSLKRIKPISPLMGKSPSYSILSKSTVSKSKISSKSIQNSLPDVISSSSVSYRNATPTKHLDISLDRLSSETKVDEKVLKKPKFIVILEKYEMYQRIFQEIIQKDKSFALILKKIKDVYEEFYETSIKEHTEKLKNKLQKNNELLIQKNEDISSLEKKIKKLSSENYELKKSLERSEEICNTVQNRLNKISKFTGPDLPKDEDTWKSLIVENEAYSISFKTLESKLNKSKQKERKLRSIIIDLKKNGFPVEEFLENINKKAKEAEYNSISGSNDSSI
jgi:hypothetical protein